MKLSIEGILHEGVEDSVAEDIKKLVGYRAWAR
jgi:hypothetical protein